jgi:hypothetical protein
MINRVQGLHLQEEADCNHPVQRVQYPFHPHPCTSLCLSCLSELVVPLTTICTLLPGHAEAQGRDRGADPPLCGGAAASCGPSAQHGNRLRTGVSAIRRRRLQGCSTPFINASKVHDAPIAHVLVGAVQVYVVELNPFAEFAGTGLFIWTEDFATLTGQAPFEYCSSPPLRSSAC